MLLASQPCLFLRADNRHLFMLITIKSLCLYVSQNGHEVLPLLQERVTHIVRSAWAHRSTGLVWWTTRWTPNGMPPCSSPSETCIRMFCVSLSMTVTSTHPMVSSVTCFTVCVCVCACACVCVCVCVCVCTHASVFMTSLLTGLNQILS